MSWSWRIGRIAGIDEPTTVVDFSGWPIVVHEKFPEELAYHIAGVQATSNVAAAELTEPFSAAASQV